jgi:uncharacterized protein YnzC (UPF0291/DUF896 family)
LKRGNAEKLKEEPQISQIDDKGRDVRPRASANVDDWPRKGAEDTKNFEEEEPQIAQISQIDGKGRDVRPARPGSGEEETLASVEGCSRTRKRLDGGRTSGKVGSLLRRARHAEIRPPVLFGRFEGVARWGTRWLMGSPDRTSWGSDLRFRV